MMTLLMLIGWMTWANAGEAIHPQASIEQAVQLLSRYPTGQIPLEDSAIDAIWQIAAEGGRAEISLLRSVAQYEGPELSETSIAAIQIIRDRQRSEQREAFARTLPNFVDLDHAALPFIAYGMGREEAYCAGYASLVLADYSPEDPPWIPGDPEMYLALGNPRKAIAAARGDRSLVVAYAREELGDVNGALHDYAWMAADGVNDAHFALDGFGVDAERLLLGLLANPTLDDSRVLRTLVENGDELTVRVLTERSRQDGSEAVSAVVALGGMLQRQRPLGPSSRHGARVALLRASRKGDLVLRYHATQALKSLHEVGDASSDTY